MKSLRLALTVSSLFAALPALAVGNTVIDQASETRNALMADFDQPDLAQSFTPGANNSSGAGIQVNGSDSQTGTISISLWSNLPNMGGSLLAGGSASGNGNSWIDVFWAPVAVTPGQTYFLVFSSAATSFSIGGDTTNPYPGGNVFANSGYESYPSYDYTFRTYAEAPPVPEPETWVSLLAGLAVTAALARRR